MIVTVALTVIVPVTVDPDAGDVMVTIRLPSWPDAGGGDVQLPRTTSTAITAANRADVRVFIALLLRPSPSRSTPGGSGRRAARLRSSIMSAERRAAMGGPAGPPVR